MAAAPVFRLRPRVSRSLTHVQGTLDLGVWSEPTKIELNQWLTARQPNTQERWVFTMVGSQAEQVKAFLKVIVDGPRPLATLAVWNGLLPYCRRDTGEMLCSQRRLADTSGIDLRDVTKALKRLVEIGALIQEGRGNYRIHPVLMWKGELAKREEAEKVTPELRLVLPTEGSPGAS